MVPDPDPNGPFANRPQRACRPCGHLTELVDETGAEAAFVCGEVRSRQVAEGLGSVCAALREGAVGTLIVGELGDATVVTGEDRTTLAPDADVLSELGQAIHRVARADEALPFAVIAIGASLIRVDDFITPVDGIVACCATPRPTYSGPTRQRARCRRDSCGA